MKNRTRKRTISPHLQLIHKELFDQVDRALSAPAGQDPLSIGLNRLYKSVEFLCRDKQQSLLAGELYQRVEVCVDGLCGKISDIRTFLDAYDLLDHRLMLIQRMFLYLDRTYLLNHPVKKTVREQALLYLHDILHDENKWDSLFSEFLQLLNSIRTNTTDDTQALRFFKAFHGLNRHNGLERIIIESSTVYYQQAHTHVRQSVELDRQFEVNYRAFIREHDFWTKCLMNDNFIGVIDTLVLDNLVRYNQIDELPEVVTSMFQTNKIDLLMILCPLVNTTVFTNGLNDYTMEHISKIIKGSKQDLLQCLIKARSSLVSLVKQSFPSLPESYRVTDSFQRALLGSSTVSRIVKSIDTYWKTENCDSDISQDDLVMIFTSIRDKEHFINLYQRDLSKRLIQQTSKDLNKEEETLQSFTNVVDSELIQPLITMIKDLPLSNQLQETFASITSSSIEFKPMVLTASAWPSVKGKTNVPDDLQSLMTSFEEFYLKDKEHQKLQWYPTMSFMVLDFSDKELHVSQFQGIILLLFNDRNSLSYEQLKQLTGMNSENLSSALYSLTKGRYKLLKLTNGTYSVNESFSERKRVLKIKQISMKLKDGVLQEAEDDDDVVTVDNSDSIRAFIVKMMKDKKECEHDVVLNNVLERFIAQREDVKKHIDFLIDREYLGRWNGMAGYRYIP